METSKDQIIVSRLGEKRVDSAKIMYFPKGLVGFEESRRFALIQIQEGSPFALLQDIEHSQLGLIVTDPYVFVPEYSVRLAQGDAEILGTSDLREMSVLVTVSIPHGEPDKTSINLCGPILVNRTTYCGLQVPQVDPRSCALVLLKDLQLDEKK